MGDPPDKINTDLDLCGDQSFRVILAVLANENPENEFASKTVDQLFSAASREDIRCVVNYFHESAEEVASVNKIAEFVATNLTPISGSSPERIAIRLHHTGLPKVADAGVLDYDPRSQTVRWWGHSLVDDRGGELDEEA